MFYGTAILEFLDYVLKHRFMCGINNERIQVNGSCWSSWAQRTRRFDLTCGIAILMEKAVRNCKEFQSISKHIFDGAYGQMSAMEVLLQKHHMGTQGINVCYGCNGNYFARTFSIKKLKCYM